MTSTSSRQYDLVLFGASGYTGKETAEHITKWFPTNLKWALAGRSESKLHSLVQELKQINPDRTPPGVEVTQLVKDELVELACKTTVLINTVGPYHKYSTPVVEACAENGTHYIDCTGELPWVKQMVERYHETAKKSGAIVIPQCGLESAPPDLLTYLLCRALRKQASVATKEVIYAVHTLKGVPSGGTWATGMGIFDEYGANGLIAASKRASLISSSLPSPTPAPAKSIFTRLFGLRYFGAPLGILTTNFVGAADVPIIYRSWSLLESQSDTSGSKSTGLGYGRNFHFSTYWKAPNAFVGTLIHLVSTLFPVLMAFKPFRYLLSKVVFAPGTGPSKEVEASGVVDSRAVAIPDLGSKTSTALEQDEQSIPRAYGKFYWKGGMYALTAVLIAEAAASLLYGEDDLGTGVEPVPARDLGGGVLTPACLGQPYWERLEARGIKGEISLSQ